MLSENRGIRAGGGAHALTFPPPSFHFFDIRSMDDITQYIGVKVKITLLNGQQITGVIAGLSKPTRTLTLRSG